MTAIWFTFRQAIRFVFHLVAWQAVPTTCALVCVFLDAAVTTGAVLVAEILAVLFASLTSLRQRQPSLPFDRRWVLRTLLSGVLAPVFLAVACIAIGAIGFVTARDPDGHWLIIVPFAFVGYAPASMWIASRIGRRFLPYEPSRA